MTGGEVIMFILGVCLGGFLGLLLAGLLRHASDLELRMAHHVREGDEHSDGLEECSGKGDRKP